MGQSAQVPALSKTHPASKLQGAVGSGRWDSYMWLPARWNFTSVLLQRHGAFFIVHGGRHSARRCGIVLEVAKGGGNEVE